VLSFVGAASTGAIARHFQEPDAAEMGLFDAPPDSN
jgi:hypothetical protein